MATMVALSKIRVPNNVRKIEGVEDLESTPLSAFPDSERQEIIDLAANIQEYGLLQPLVVKDLGGGKAYRLIAGYRRYKALQLNGSKMADVKSIKGKTEDETLLKLFENIHRKDLNPYEIALSLEQIKREKMISKQTSLARTLSKSQGWVSQHLSLLTMDPDIQKLVSNGTLGLAAARQVATVPREDQLQVVAEVKEEAKKTGKVKINAAAVRRKTDEKKAKNATKQILIRPVKEREAEQKQMVCDAFLSKYKSTTDVRSINPYFDAKEVVESFWDYLMAADRLYIFK